MKILLVDDNFEIRSMFKDVLSDRGHQVEDYESAQRVLFAIGDKAQHWDFDAVITDFNMPGMNGLQFLTELKRLGVEVPKYMISATVDASVPLQAAKLGALFFDKLGMREVLNLLSKEQK